MTGRLPSAHTPRVAVSCPAPAPCSPGPHHASPAQPARAIRDSSSSCFEARSTAFRRSGPTGDPDMHCGDIALSRTGPERRFTSRFVFSLNPGMPNFHRLFYRRAVAAIVHAVATPYRGNARISTARTRFERLRRSGVCDLGLAAQPRACGSASRRNNPASAAASGGIVTIVLRGQTPVVGSPQVVQPAGEDLAQRLLDLYRHNDPALGDALSYGLDIDRIAGRVNGETSRRDGFSGRHAGTPRGAAKLLAADDGPRIAALSFDGWDTHANEGGPARASGAAFVSIRLRGNSRRASATNGAETFVIAITEFGRTARIMAARPAPITATATVAFLTAAAVVGGQVIADWPGLRGEQLFPAAISTTTDLRAVLKGALADHLGLGVNALGTLVFPGLHVRGPMKAWSREKIRRLCRLLRISLGFAYAIGAYSHAVDMWPAQCAEKP